MRELQCQELYTWNTIRHGRKHGPTCPAARSHYCTHLTDHRFSIYLLIDISGQIE